ncbi:DUF3800 domain-containing protein [Oscillospiraceae bacterium 38-13]
MYGFMDESGAPGAATSYNDFLVVSLVLFSNKETMENCSAAIDRLRKRLGKTPSYEFHRSSNSPPSQREFGKLLRGLDFRFITVAIRKSKMKKHASYARITELLIREILAQELTGLKIEMDSNPHLYAELRKHLKLRKLTSIHVKEQRSHSNNLIQLADYVVNISSKYSLQETTQGNGLTGADMPVRFSM